MRESLVVLVAVLFSLVAAAGPVQRGNVQRNPSGGKLRTRRVFQYRGATPGSLASSSISCTASLCSDGASSGVSTHPYANIEASPTDSPPLSDQSASSLQSNTFATIVTIPTASPGVIPPVTSAPPLSTAQSDLPTQLASPTSAPDVPLSNTFASIVTIPTVSPGVIVASTSSLETAVGTDSSQGSLETTSILSTSVHSQGFSSSLVLPLVSSATTLSTFFTLTGTSFIPLPTLGPSSSVSSFSPQLGTTSFFTITIPIPTEPPSTAPVLTSVLPPTKSLSASITSATPTSLKSSTSSPPNNSPTTQIVTIHTTTTITPIATISASTGGADPGSSFSLTTSRRFHHHHTWDAAPIPVFTDFPGGGW